MSTNKVLDINGTQYVNGLEDPDVSNIFVISGNSMNYSWSKTDDGTGIVVWNNDTKEPDILLNIDYIAFSDGYVTANNDGTFSFVNEIDEVPNEPDANKIHNETGTQYVHGTAGKDTFVIDGNSSDYNWDKTEDGTGTVVWNIASGEPDILCDVENIQFTDSLIDLAQQPCSYQDPSDGHDANLIYDKPGTEFVHGTTDKDIFVVDGNSSDYNWDKTEDGTGTVVWNIASGEPDILWDVECIQFNDGVIDLTAQPSSHQDPSGGDDANLIYNEAGTQFINGTTDKDTFVINGKQEEYNWNPTEDGTGTVIWNVATGEHDILWGVECIKFTDNTIELAETPHYCLPGTENNSSIGDRVWLDANGNGVQDAGENGLENVTVQLKNENGTVVSTQQTDVSGNYLFDNLAAGTYSIGVVAPNGFEFTTIDANGNSVDGSDSDINATTGMSANVVLGENEHNTTIDAGLVPETADPKSAIGDRVWLDANKNGLQETGEAGVSGVTVQLKDANGAVISTQQTDANGDYLFTNLAAGTYSVGVVAPDGFDFTGQDALNNGIDTLDSDINVTTGMSQNVVLGENETNLTIDAGLVEEPGPKNSLGDYIWLDENKNGIQEAGEAGIGGVSVQLKDQNGMVLENTVTAADGSYQFDNLDDGTYSVGVVAPDGFDFTGQDALNNGIDILDSDIDATTGMSHQVSLAGGENDPTIDGGLVEIPVATSSLGDKVWFDANKNGVQDADEMGVGDITVQLKDGDNNVLDSQVTAVDGSYLFDNLEAGDYSVGFVAPDGAQFTEQNAFGNNADTIDSDVNVTTGMTDVITLGENEQNLTVDAGLLGPIVHADGTIWGDPHFVGADGGKFDVHGEHGKYYNILSDSGLQVNARFGNWGNNGATIMSEFGLVVDGEEIAFNRAGQLYIDGETTSKDGSYLDGSVVKKGNSVTVSTDEYDITMYIKSGSIGTYLNFDFASDNVAADGVLPHGIWGQTADGDGIARNGDTGASAQGGGAIEDADGNITARGDKQAYKIYEVDGLFDTTFAHHNINLRTPIALDLNGDGEIGVTGETSSHEKDANAEIGQTVEFDIDADGKLDNIEWFDGSGDGILIDNRDGNAATIWMVHVCLVMRAANMPMAMTSLPRSMKMTMASLMAKSLPAWNFGSMMAMQLSRRAKSRPLMIMILSKYRRRWKSTMTKRVAN